MPLTDAVLMVTSRCNSKCVICGAWRDNPCSELAPEKYWQLPKTLKRINISGGEPFMREDLPEILRVISKRCKGARLVISTNGLLLERIRKQLPVIANNVSRLGVRVSLDGVEDVHDRSRGIPGNFRHCIEVIKYCNQIGVKDLGIGTTISKLNESNFSQVKDLADSLHVQFTCTVVHNSPILFGPTEDIAPEAKLTIYQLRRIQDSFLKSSLPKDWFRAYFTEGIIKYLEGEPRQIKCMAGQVFAFIKANGDVFPCILLNNKMGNFVENAIGDIMANSGEVLSYVRSCEKRCWMICTVAPMIRRNPFPPALWVIRKKLSQILLNG